MSDTVLIVVAPWGRDVDLVEVPCLERNGMFALAEHNAPGYRYSVTHVPSGLAGQTFPLDVAGLRKARYLLSCLPPSIDYLPLMPPRDEEELRLMSVGGTPAETLVRKIVSGALLVFEAIDREEFLKEARWSAW